MVHILRSLRAKKHVFAHPNIKGEEREVSFVHFSRTMMIFFGVKGRICLSWQLVLPIMSLSELSQVCFVVYMEFGGI